MKVITCLFIFTFSLFAHCIEPTNLSKSLESEKTFEEKEQDLINYNSIKDAIKSDGLEKQQTIKKKVISKISKERLAIAKEKFDLPDDEFWSFMTELWLV